MGPFCANGVSTLRLKGSPCGSLLLVGSLGRKEEVGGGWSTREVREGYGVGFWKEIRKEGSLMLTNYCFFVRDGRRVRF